MEILCIGSAVLDIQASPIEASDTWMEKQRIDEISLRLGGDAANQAVRLADLGRDVSLCAALGDDTNGSILTSILQDRKVDTRFLSVKKHTPTGTSLVILDSMGERHTFSTKGAHSLIDGQDVALFSNTEKAPERDSAHLQEYNVGWDYPRVISLASLFSMPHLEDQGLFEFLGYARNVHRALVFADLGSDKRKQGFDGIRRFLPQIDYFLPSEYDALAMTQADTVEEAARIYLEAGCPHVIIKCGEKGCYYLTHEEEGWVQALPVQPIDTTGAGDSMVAFFIHAILRGKDMRNALQFACRGASISTLYKGACDHRLEQKDIDSFIL